MTHTGAKMQCQVDIYLESKTPKCLQDNIGEYSHALESQKDCIEDLLQKHRTQRRREKKMSAFISEIDYHQRHHKENKNVKPPTGRGYLPNAQLSKRRNQNVAKACVNQP